ncbi:MAG: alpha-amylase family glycosyl hydrolase [Saprospiraceae bacterium]|nr:alpha-amylase family glycosyl hydrolase [Saprospiraceae bacterium]
MNKSSLLGYFLLFLFSCSPIQSSDETSAQIQQAAAGSDQTPEWIHTGNLYEVNIRQYTPEGTFAAFETHLPRLRDMGIKILWLMPISPISQAKRKGTLGSYYAVSDFRQINPEFGNEETLHSLIQKIHELDMKVVLDWVPHHTGWDHTWITEHPEYYSTDENGNIIDPINEETGEPWDWTDVAELKLDNREMRKAMAEDMKYWITEFQIDGYRIDHAHRVPLDYWQQLIPQVKSLGREIFLLAEGEDPWLRNRAGFDATYSWHFHHTMNDIAQGRKNANALDYLLWNDRNAYAKGFHVYFTSNHDENSWAGTVMERMGDGHKAFAVLCSTIDGMPLIYSGQEEPLQKRLEFFEKDAIEWKDYRYANLYKTLSAEKVRNEALWNGEAGGRPIRINQSKEVFAFKREKNEDSIVVLLNLTDDIQITQLTETVESHMDIFTDESITIRAESDVVLQPWEFLVLSRVK